MSDKARAATVRARDVGIEIGTGEDPVFAGCHRLNGFGELTGLES